MKEKSLNVILLAAGYSTRLYPLTRNFPKPLLEVGGKPVITSIVEKLESLNEINNIYVITNNRYFNHFTEWMDNLRTNLDIEILNDGTLSEEDKLGAVGDIYFAIKEKKIRNPIMIAGGDNLFDFELGSMYSYFLQKNRDVVSLCRIDDVSRLRQLGVVEMDNNNRIIHFNEKPDNPNSNLAANCIYFYTRETIAMFKEYLEQGNNPDQPGRFIEWLYPRKEIYGFINNGRIIDIGTYETLEKARKEFTFSSCS